MSGINPINLLLLLLLGGKGKTYKGREKWFGHHLL
jgi:hypothetical protein